LATSETASCPASPWTVTEPDAAPVDQPVHADPSTPGNEVVKSADTGGTVVVVVVVGTSVVVVVVGTSVVVVGTSVVVVVGTSVVVVVGTSVVVVVVGTSVVVVGTSVVVVVVGTSVVVVVAPTSPVEARAAAKLRSLDDGESWWTSTAIVLVPGWTEDGGMAKERTVDSSTPDRPLEARVVAVSAPLGRLSRTTSTPFR